MPNNFVYNIKARRYRDADSGKFVADKAVRASVDVVIDKQTELIKGLASDLVGGKINIADWQLQTSALVKKLHVAMGLVANGGLENTSNADLGFIGSKVKEQYKFLRSFAKQIKSGAQMLDGTLVSRAALYGQSARSTYEDVRARNATNGGATQERSQLGPADHCSECVGEADKGWSPIGSLIPIGERLCKANCRCTMQYK